MRPPAERDLLVLTADADAAATVTALLGRHVSLGIRPITFQVLRHPQRDPGVYLNAHEFLRNFTHGFHHCLAMCDHEGSGAEAASRQDVTVAIRQRIQASGWGPRGDAVVIAPELENWVWGQSNQIPRILGWEHDNRHLRDFLVSRSLLADNADKPRDPKLAMQTVLRENRIPFSPSLFSELGSKVSWKGCTDPSFVEFLAILRRWFPADQG